MSSLTQVLRLLGTKDQERNDLDIQTPFAILTAYVSDFSSEINSKRVAQLSMALKRQGIRTFKLTGNWLEPAEGATKDEAETHQEFVEIPEEALFCVPKDVTATSFEDFHKTVLQHADHFGQQSAIVSDGKTIWLCYKDGHLRELGRRADVHSLQEAYKTMRQQREHQFVFSNSDEIPGYAEASSLSRLLRMLGTPSQETENPNEPPSEKNPGKIKVKRLRAFAILTAWRDIFDEAENKRRNKELLAKLNAAKMGPYHLVGYFQNPPEGFTYDEARRAGKLGTPSREESFLVVKPEVMSFEDFNSFIGDLALKTYEQWAYIVCDGEVVYEVSSAGMRKLGTEVVMPLIEQAYSKMRNHEDKPFVFAGTSTPVDMGMMRYYSAIGLCWVTPPTPQQRKLMASLRDLVVSAIKFSEFKSHGGFSKMWIDPKHRPIPLDGKHSEWVMHNAAFSQKAFNITNALPSHDEQKVRFWALMHGFTRVNYNPRNGEVTFDTCEKFWTSKRQSVVSMIIADNADEIDHITVNVYSNDMKRLVKDGSSDVVDKGSAAAKVEVIPCADTKTTKLIAECLKRFGA